MRRRGRHGDDEPPGARLRTACDRRPHRRAGGQTVVDEHDRLAAQVGQRPVAAVGPLAPLELLPLALRHALDHVVAEPQLPHELLVEHARAAARDRPHRQLGLARVAELADEEDVERRPERPRDLARHRHAAARQRRARRRRRGPRSPDSRSPSSRPASARSRKRPPLLIGPNHVLNGAWSARTGTGAGASGASTARTTRASSLEAELGRLAAGTGARPRLRRRPRLDLAREPRLARHRRRLLRAALDLGARERRRRRLGARRSARRTSPNAARFDLVLVLYVHLPVVERQAIAARARCRSARAGRNAPRRRPRPDEPRHRALPARPTPTCSTRRRRITAELPGLDVRKRGARRRTARRSTRGRRRKRCEGPGPGPHEHDAAPAASPSSRTRRRGRSARRG